MKLSPRSKSYIIPEYSLTGDLLSFLTCNLQYRYQNKGTLPPSMPIQLWFGEFIHGVMEEAYLKWELNKTEFPWDWKKEIRPIEDMIDLRLQVRGLYPPENHFFTTNSVDSTITYEDINEYDHQKLASARAERAINIWGPHLFPLIDSTELLIKGLRNMPDYDENESRSNYYGINGVIDVLSSLQINTVNESENKIVEYLKQNEEFNNKIKELETEEYEIIIDYKGMKRPSLDDKNWIYHKWQVLTYSWLRSKQEDAKPVVAGIILYLNELVPSNEDLIAIQKDINGETTDIEIPFNDYEILMNWDEDKEYPELSDGFKTDRSIRIIPIDEEEIKDSLERFDNVVLDIENSLIKESRGAKIKDAWCAKAEERTCSACDFKTFCKNKTKEFKVP